MNNVKIPPPRTTMDNFEGTLEVYRTIAKVENLSESEIESRIIYATKMHNVILELFKNNKNFSKPKYGRSSVSYFTNRDGKKKTKFADLRMSPAGVGDLYKDHKKDFKMPKINNVDTLQLRVFNKTAKSWAFSYAYRLNLGLEGYDNNIEIINQLILRSAEILESSEPTLPEVKNTSKLDDKELDRLVLIGSNDYTYDA